MNVYLDYAATTPLGGEVLEEMLPLLKENFGNPDSLHSYGRSAAQAVTRARDRIAEALAVKSSEVYFTSGGTEADNWAVQKIGRGSVCVSAIEHSAALSAADLRAGGKSVARSNAGGIVTAEAVKSALSEHTGLACVMAVNNETGCVQPLEEISALCKERGIPLFSDCVQAACTQDLKKICALADAVSLSGHKIYGPKGIGFLVVKKGVKITPLVAGGEQERGLRGGTLNPAACVGLAAALERAQAEREAFCARAEKLRALFEKNICAALGGEAAIDGENRASNISHMTFSAGGERLLSALDLAGVACSGGAACSAHSALPSHVMLAMGRTEEESRRGVRFSFGRETTEEEVLFAAERVIACAKRR